MNVLRIFKFWGNENCPFCKDSLDGGEVVAHEYRYFSNHSQRMIRYIHPLHLECATELAKNDQLRNCLLCQETLPDQAIGCERDILCDLESKKLPENFKSCLLKCNILAWSNGFIVGAIKSAYSSLALVGFFQIIDNQSFERINHFVLSLLGAVIYSVPLVEATAACPFWQREMGSKDIEYKRPIIAGKNTIHFTDNSVEWKSDYRDLYWLGQAHAILGTLVATSFLEEALIQDDDYDRDSSMLFKLLIITIYFCLKNFLFDPTEKLLRIKSFTIEGIPVGGTD